MTDEQAQDQADELSEAAASPAEELRRLVGAARSHLQWLSDQGVSWVPGGATPRRAPLPPPAQAVHPRPSPSGHSAPSPTAPVAPVSMPELAGLPTGAAGLARIREVLGDCTRCRLSGGRIQLVFGQGSPEAALMFVGEAPGRDEDLAGEAFVGAAGALLTKMIGAMGLTRDRVYIANVIKCRPPRNRDPEPEESATCGPFVRAQIEAIQPAVIVTLGRHAAQALLATDAPVGKLRGTFHGVEIGGRRIPLMPTYHPAYLLRNPEAKRPVWEDLKQVITLLREGGHLPA